MKKIFLFFIFYWVVLIIALLMVGCSTNDPSRSRYSGSNYYHRTPAHTNSGPNSGKYYNR